MTSEARTVALPVQAIREIDRLAVEEFGMNSLVLMENAGNGVAFDLVNTHSSTCSATVLCGAGNNGGDGFVIARHLDYYGWNVKVWLLGLKDRMSPDCRANWEVLRRSDVHINLWSQSSAPTNLLMNELSASNVIVDAMLGTGQKGSPTEPFATAIELSNRVAAKRIAIDVPTGLDAETGEVWNPAFQADCTYTFVAFKTGFATSTARQHLGEVKVCSIGVPRKLVRRFISA